MNFDYNFIYQNNMNVSLQNMAWRRPGDKPMSEPMIVSSLASRYTSLGIKELTFLLYLEFHEFSTNQVRGLCCRYANMGPQWETVYLNKRALVRQHMISTIPESPCNNNVRGLTEKIDQEYGN